MSEHTDKPEQTASFVRRWSRRKIAAGAEPVEDIQIEAALANMASPDHEPEEYKTDADMPSIDELTEESDYSGFLSPRVTDALRKQALRKMFHMPSMNIVDGLDDYAEDFTSFVGLGDIIPHEMKRMLERELAKEEAKKRDSETAQAQQDHNCTNTDEVENTSPYMESDDSTSKSYFTAAGPDLNTAKQEIILDQQLQNHKDNIENEQNN